MEMKSKLGSGPQTIMLTYTEWLKQEGLNPASLEEKQKSYQVYLTTYMKLIEQVSAIENQSYILEFYQQNFEQWVPETATDCDTYETMLNDFAADVNLVLQVQQQPAAAKEIAYLYIPIEADGLTLSSGGKNVVSKVFVGNLGLKCLIHYGTLYVGGKIISIGETQKTNPMLLTVYVTNVEMQMASISKSEAGEGGLRLDFQTCFTLHKEAGGQVFQNVCLLFAEALKKSKQLPAPQAIALQTFCNSCLAFNTSIKLANWHTQMGAQGAKQKSYSAVLMGESVEVPLAIFIDAHYISVNKQKRCYILVLPPLVIAALRSLELYDKVMSVVQAALK